VNSRGITIPTKELRRVLEINVFGTFNVVKYAAKAMMAQ
jgi:NAD(P)-dependent dehydrogenase (short-subunit alcohol dehydrogenase family)